MTRSNDPLWLLLLAGGLIFALNGWLQGKAEQTIRLTPEQRAIIIDNQRAVLGRAPTTAEATRLADQWLVDELLFREALREGLHLASSEIRAAIIDTMRKRVAGTLPEPDAEALVTYYAAHLDRYRAEPTAWFRHVYFDTEPAASTAVLQQLSEGAAVAGDPFWQGSDFDGYSERMLRDLFGAEFTGALWALPLDAWSGPLRSRHGWHFVRPSRREPSRQLPYAAVVAQVENDYLVSVIRERTDAFIAERGPAYDVKPAAASAATP